MRARLPRRLSTGEEATLVEHLGELRTRLFVSMGALLLCFTVAFIFHHRLLVWLNAPLPDGYKPTTLTVAEPFLVSLKVSLWAGFGLALPVILWQLWAFLAPAIDEHAQRMIVGMVAFATVLLACGVAFGYFLALPAATHYLLGYDKSSYNILVQAKGYYSFAITVMAAVGLVFELPIFVLALVRLRILTTQKLRKNRRLGYFVVACVGVALPGVDPVTTIIETAPLAVLYEASIWLAVFLEKRWQQAPGAAEVVSPSG
jgi:sec-independent protein translocase protein TatC